MCNFTALFRELLLLKEWMVARYCEVLRFAPSRGRELKYTAPGPPRTAPGFAPSRGRELKLISDLQVIVAKNRLPPRGGVN